MTESATSGHAYPSEQWHRSLFEESRDAILVSEREGAIVEANQAASDLFGYSRAEIIGIDVRSLCAHPADRARFKEEIERQGFVRDYELKLRTKVGGELDCLLTTSVRKDVDGTVLGYQGIVRNVSDRKSLENKLLSYQQELRSLAAQMGQTEERERRRIAEGLHDQVGQTLALAYLKLEPLRASSSDGDRVELMDQVLAALDQMDVDVRSLTFDLSPPVLYALGIRQAIEWFGEQLTRQHGLKVFVEEDEGVNPVQEDMRALLFRCVRELLLNVVKHARAGTATVRLYLDGLNLCIGVEDDGCGFDVAALDTHRGAGFGLFSVQERLRFAGGEFYVKSCMAEGTCCTLSVPNETAGSQGG